MRQYDRWSQAEVSRRIRGMCNNDHQARIISRVVGDYVAEQTLNQLGGFIRVKTEQYGYVPRAPVLPGMMNPTNHSRGEGEN
ncbi:MAG: hypothetical protein GY847_01490 [Proteobacteria bacterium]|nr:hypothetical protein [Pseudomonadota bacterium]